MVTAHEHDLEEIFLVETSSDNMVQMSFDVYWENLTFLTICRLCRAWKGKLMVRFNSMKEKNVSLWVALNLWYIFRPYIIMQYIFVSDIFYALVEAIHLFLLGKAGTRWDSILCMKKTPLSDITHVVYFPILFHMRYITVSDVFCASLEAIPLFLLFLAYFLSVLLYLLCSCLCSCQGCP